MGKIELKGVEKAFGNVQVIQGVDLVVEDGSFVVFVGPSGCGKSTLLRLIAGLEDATGGAILIDGVDVIDQPPGELRAFHGFPVLRALPAHDCAEQHRLRAPDGRRGRPERDQKVGRSCGAPQSDATISTAGRPRSPAANASASRSAAPSCASRRRSSSTSRCRTSTPRSASTCAWRSRGCRRASAPPRSTSPTTRSRP